MSKLYRSINLLVIPTDSCNMSCLYCFHKPHFETKNVMSQDILKRIIDLACTEYEAVQFVWHGGEPLLAGLDFYRNVIKFQQFYEKCKIRNTLQCNLTLLTKDVASFFIDNHFGIGSSFDGIDNEKTRGNTDKILENYHMFKTLGTDIGFIMVLSSYTVNSLVESYELFKKINANFSINNYVSLVKEKDIIDPFYTSPDTIIAGVCNLFDYWVNDSSCSIHLNTFEEYLKFLNIGKTNKCRFNSCLGHWLCIRPDGKLMPCNRYFSEQYSFGNINQVEKLSDAYDSAGFKLLLSEAIQRRETCKSCELFSLCKGGCNNIAYSGGDISKPNGTYCHILKEIFKHLESWWNGLSIQSIKNPIVKSLCSSHIYNK